MGVLAALFATVLALGGSALAAGVVVITPAHQDTWGTADTRTGGDVEFVADATAPRGSGALQLTTDATTTAKAQYLHPATVAIADVTEMSYSTRQISASFAGGDASYQFIVDLNGDGAGGFTTFVYEPYENGSVVNDAWQSWDVDAGQMWSSRSFSEGACMVTAGAGGAPFYTLAWLQANCPAAVTIGFGVNVGSNNPSYVINTDGVSFNGTVYDFEVTNVPANKDACKDGGWMTLTDANGNAFVNQGQCVASVVSTP
jgi:hypothetical protein